MICKNCSATIDDNAAFCPYCGTATEVAQNNQQQPNAQYQQDNQYYYSPQPNAQQPNYQQGNYQQPNYQQPNYQQPNYQQQNYQQPNYQQQGYQQQYYQQQPYQQTDMNGNPVQGGVKPPKDKIAAGLLAIFLGTFGIHKFYLGYTKSAVIMLLVSLLTLGFAAPVIAIIGLIEGILYLTKSDEEFNQIYVQNTKEWS